MILTISKKAGKFEVDDKSRPGSPPVGRGRTIKEAIGDFFWYNNLKFGITFAVDKSASESYDRHRRREFENYR